MTLIECFTDSHIDNLAACLRLRPEKMVLVGDAGQMNDPVERYRKLLDRRGYQVEIYRCDVQGKDFGDICATLEKLVRAEAECVIDLTGGDELVIMAVGAVLAGLDANARQHIRVEKYDYTEKAVLDCINDNRELPYKRTDLSVEELIFLHGGSIHPSAYQPPEEFRCKDLEKLWKVAAEDSKQWNRSVAYLNEFESRADSKTQVYLEVAHLRGNIGDFDRKESAVRELLGKLHRCGAVDDCSSRDALEYTYSSSVMRYCTRKAGNILELKTLLEGREVLENGGKFFRDCRMSVSIDWDGVVHKPQEHKQETRNEIDVVLMHGLTPLFISCKNGTVEEEELYKLNTVAQRFGGPYAKKMLIATELDQKSSSANRALIQRAWDMDIVLVTDAGELTREEWKQVFIQAVQ